MGILTPKVTTTFHRERFFTTKTFRQQLFTARQWASSALPCGGNFSSYRCFLVPRSTDSPLQHINSRVGLILGVISNCSVGLTFWSMGFTVYMIGVFFVQTCTCGRDVTRDRHMIVHIITGTIYFRKTNIVSSRIFPGMQMPQRLSYTLLNSSLIYLRCRSGRIIAGLWQLATERTTEAVVVEGRTA